MQFPLLQSRLKRNIFFAIQISCEEVARQLNMPMSLHDSSTDDAHRSRTQATIC